MASTDEALQELNAMMDEGVRLELVTSAEGSYRLRVVLEDMSCADCLVPDATLRQIAADTLRRRNLIVDSVAIEHA
ncbi:MAG: hypothetical protein GEU81_17670 [Nitriliruptorales bacterium]|nr:hypothetical protein [Nitriliruptorales bacterium]